VFAALSAEPSTFVADWVGRIARFASYTAVLLGIGAFLFAVFVFHGSRSEALKVGFWARRAGFAILLAVPLEIASQAMLVGGGSLFAWLNPTRIIEALAGQFGLAVLMRAAGGLGLLLGTQLVTADADPAPVRGIPPGGHLGSGGTAVAVKETFHVAASPMAVAGAVLVALSFIFDGHTAVTAPSWLVRFAAVVHVAAAATWVGGVAMLAAVFAGRRRRGEDLDAARLVIPFSTVAGLSVALVGLAGSVLALSTVDAFGEFFTTPWGRALLAKLALVMVAGGVGAYNHYTLVPLLQRNPDHAQATDAVTASVRIEIGLLVAVAAVTAILVGLAS
jgi:copper transport protein